MKTFLKISALGLLAASILGLPLSLSAQTNAPSTNVTKTVTAKKKAATAKKPAAGPFHGNLAAMDKVAKTITVGTRTFQVTAETMIFKDSKPATFDDGVVGEPVSGYVKPAADGKWNATKVNFGAKTTTKGAAAKAAAKPAPEAGSTK